MRASSSLLGLLVLVAFPACSSKSKDPDPVPLPSATADATTPPSATPPASTTSIVQIPPPAAPGTLPEAIALSKPRMSDSTGAPDEGSKTLTGYWLEKKYPWSQLESTPEIQAAAFLSSTESERGKRICGSGAIQQLTQPTPGTPQHEGMMATKEGVTFSLGAVGDTTGMKPGGQGRFCGVASGTQTIATPDGKQVRAIRLTGMFDTPANRGASPGQGASFAACCQALQQNATSAPTPQNMYLTAAAQYCFGSLAMLNDPAQKNAALGQLRGKLQGAALPAQCR